MNILFPLLSFTATLILTLISSFVLDLTPKESFIIFSTGTSVTLALALIEQRLQSDFKDVRDEISGQLSERLDLYKAIDQIQDEQLVGAVLSLAKRLSSGEVPSHIAALRVPMLYDTAERSVYASNVSRTCEDLLQWSNSPRFQQIIEVSRARAQTGVKFTRTFLLNRAQVQNSDGTFKKDCTAALRQQHDAGIEVRIIWIEDFEKDAVMPTRKLDKNFTIFDNEEAVETSDFQVIWRKPSKRLDEIIDISQEQLKYSFLYLPET